jgi:hypothetical protein
MKKTIILCVSLLFASLVTFAQQNQTIDKSKPVTGKQQEPVKAEPQVKQAPNSKVSSPAKVQTRTKPGSEKAPATKPDPRLRVKRAKPEEPKQAIKKPTDSK